MLIRQRFLTQNNIPVSGLVELVKNASGIDGNATDTFCQGVFPEQGRKVWPYIIVSSGPLGNLQ